MVSDKEDSSEKHRESIEWDLVSRQVISAVEF
jgi:hypothetical protein